jgi:hypothetical protein
MEKSDPDPKLMENVGSGTITITVVQDPQHCVVWQNRRQHTVKK